jgi:adenosylhomocysteine nucleosidase
MPLAILSAMEQELAPVLEAIRNRRTTRRAGREFHAGELFGVPVVAAFSRWGKVAAASTTTELILSHDASAVVFTGVAGAVSPRLRVGDIVVATTLAQHDMDASPLFPPGEIPLLGMREFRADPTWRDRLAAAARCFAEAESPGVSVALGPIASGDRFIGSESARRAVRRICPEAIAVEMEGAAAAQVCHEHDIPFACIRTISDAADDKAHHDVMPFINQHAGRYAVGILSRALNAAAKG